MASTKRPRTEVSQGAKDLVTLQLDQLCEQVKQKLAQYLKQHGKPYHTQLVTKVEEVKPVEKPAEKTFVENKQSLSIKIKI